MVQSPRSAGMMQENNLKRKRFVRFVPFHLSVRTKSVVEIHERSVLRQLKLCRDESEARGREEREHCCGFVLIAKQHCSQTKVLDDEHASSMMSIASSAGKWQLCSAKQVSEARGSTIRRPMPRSAALILISSITKRCSRLRRLDECEQLAVDRHAARNSGRQTRRAAEPDSGLDAIEQEQKVALVAARVRHAPRQRLASLINKSTQPPSLI
jgi:hypothetical protein